MKFIIEKDGQKIYKSLSELTEEDYLELIRQPENVDGIDIEAGFYWPPWDANDFRE